MDRSEGEKQNRKILVRVRDAGKPGVANRRSVNKVLIVELLNWNDSSRSVKGKKQLANSLDACMILIITYSRTRDWFYK